MYPHIFQTTQPNNRMNYDYTTSETQNDCAGRRISQIAKVMLTKNKAELITPDFQRHQRAIGPNDLASAQTNGTEKRYQK